MLLPYFHNFAFIVTGDGQVNNKEFDEGWSHADFVLLSDANIVFSDVDSDHSGQITGHPDMDALFAKYDSNGSLN